ncbi:MAG: hypothetical protein AAF750_01990 [Planctomycetota bacterium]
MNPLIRKRILAGGLIALAVASLTGAGYYFWMVSPPPMPDTIEEARAVMVSDRYARLPEERKRAYQERFVQIVRELPEQERDQVFAQMREDPEFRDAAREARRAEMIARIREWWEAPVDQRDAIMDRQLAEQAGRRGGRPGGGGGGGGGGDRPQRPDDTRTDEQREADRAERRNRLRERIEDSFSNGNPQEQAMMGEYFRSRRERSANRN